MFDFLKKKIGGLIDGLTKKEPKKESEILEHHEPLPKVEQEKPKKIDREIEVEKKIEEKFEVEKAQEKIEPEKIQKKKETIVKEEKPKEKPTKHIKVEKPKQQIPPRNEPKSLENLEPLKVEREEKTEPISVEIEEQKPIDRIQLSKLQKEAPAKSEPPNKERMKIGIVSAVKSIITNEVEIKANEVEEMLETFELELLESDVEFSVAEGIKEELSSKLIGKKIKRGGLHNFVSGAIKETIVDTLSNEKAANLVEKLEGAQGKPLKVMFFGINGAGKTTTIAKVAKLLMDNKKKVVFAAADTFRAAAIEQMMVHADRLSVKVIKREYGSDPTSVAYDAVSYARAHAIDAVLIDTAGRQDTNLSLINEMKKMVRVIEPDIKIYIGESIAGNAIIEQISTFNREIGVDGVILTKLDCDPKGGTMLSINKATGIPIIYLGIGQKYEDLERFEAVKIAERIVG